MPPPPPPPLDPEATRGAENLPPTPPDLSPNDSTLVYDLAAECHAAAAAGRPLTPAHVCRDHPHLIPHVQAILDAGERVNAVRPPAGPPTLGGYRLLRELGRGGMGRVYAAEDPGLHRTVAVKVMAPELAADPAARERFLREARAQAAVQHDHVAVIHDVKQADDGTPFLVLPLLTGETLAARLARADGPLPVAEVVRVARDVAEGLAAAHAKGLIHRDIKPGNIWLEGVDGKVKVLDFGLARSLVRADGDAETLKGTPVGTPAYMPPEQASGQPADARADLFSLGAVMFEMATGRRAFAGDSVFATLTAVATHTPPPARTLNTDIPETVSELITGLLAKDPAARTPATAKGVADTLRWVPRAKPSTAGPVQPTPSNWIKSVAFVTIPLLTITLCIGPLNPLHLFHEPLQNNINNTFTGNQNTSSTSTDDQNRPPAPTPATYTGSVDVFVRRDSAEGGASKVSLSDPRAMPIKPGDLFVIEASASPAAYLYLFWIDETGQAAPVYPWQPGQWGTRPAGERPQTELTVRSPTGNYFEVTGDTAGMETILMIARPEKLTATEDEIKSWFARLKPVPFRGEKARIWLEAFDVLSVDKTRAVNWTGAVDDSDPARQQQLLRQRIGVPKPGLVRAVTFARLGK